MSESTIRPRVLEGVTIDQQAHITRCTACYRQIWFGRTRAGKPCPFDVVEGERTAITHFSTCTRVRDFEKRRR